MRVSGAHNHTSAHNAMPHTQDEKAAAVKVTSDVPTLNTTPHVTVAISPIGTHQSGHIRVLAPRGGSGTHQKRDAGRAKDSNDIKAWRPVRVTGQTYPEEEPQEERKAEDNASTAEGEAQEVAAAAPLEPIWVDHKIVLKGKIFQNVRYDFNKRLSPTWSLSVGRLLTHALRADCTSERSRSRRPRSSPSTLARSSASTTPTSRYRRAGCGTLVANRR